MQVTIIPIVIGAFGTVTKGLLEVLGDLEVGGRVETVHTTVLLRKARILRRVLELEETCCHSNPSERPSAKAGVKNSNNDYSNNKEKYAIIGYHIQWKNVNTMEYWSMKKRKE